MASTIRYWAVKLTAAAAAARTHRPAAALRSHKPDRSLGHLGGVGWLPGRTPGRLAGHDHQEAGGRGVAGGVPAGSGAREGDGRDRDGHVRSLPWWNRGSWSVPRPASGVRTPTPISRRVVAPMRVRGAPVRLMCAFVVADPGDENDKDADCRAGKESSDSDERDGECHCVTRLLLCRPARMTAARSDSFGA